MEKRKEREHGIDEGGGETGDVRVEEVGCGEVWWRGGGEGGEEEVRGVR